MRNPFTKPLAIYSAIFAALFVVAECVPGWSNDRGGEAPAPVVSQGPPAAGVVHRPITLGDGERTIQKTCRVCGKTWKETVYQEGTHYIRILVDGRTFAVCPRTVKRWLVRELGARPE